MGRQVTIYELEGELQDACQRTLDAGGSGKDAGQSALHVILDHLRAGDRIKVSAAPERSRQPVTCGEGDYGYRVGDPDPTPDDPPWCGARPHPGGAWCTWRPQHDGPHVSADEMGILAVFEEVAEFHKDSGKTREEIEAEAEAQPELPVGVIPAPPSDTVLWRMSETMREHVRVLAKADKVGKRDLLEVVQHMAILLGAVVERVEG